MDIFRSIAVLLLATAATGKPASTVNDNAYEFNNTAVFTKIVPTNDLSNRDAIYVTPELLFVGKSNGDIIRCLFRDPSVCEMFYSYSSSVGVTSTVISGEYLYASLANGVMLKCYLYQKKSCTVFNSMYTGINGLAVSAGYIHAGLNNGQLLRCDLDEPNKCTTLKEFQQGIMSLAATEKYIYASLASKTIWRCSVASENSCRLIDSAEPVSAIRGMTAFEETVIGITQGGTTWNCTRGYNCTVTSMPGDKYTSMAFFERSFYMMYDSKILNCKWGSFICSTYDQHEGASVISFTYSTYKMQDRLVNEEKTCLSDARCPPFKVYYEIHQRSVLEVFVKGGRLYNSRGMLVDTTNADVGHAGRAAIFAMGADGQILLSNIHNTLLQSSSLFAGQPVAGAGEMVVESGVIKSIRACSDHYRPTVELNQQVINALYMKGYTDCIDNLQCLEEEQTTIQDPQQHSVTFKRF